MINKETLTKKLDYLVPNNKEQFKVDLSIIKKLLIDNKPNYKKPLLVHSTINKNAIFYMVTVYFSLQADKILNFLITTGQNIITQHFLDNENKDMDFNSRLYYDDILFISISQVDYTSNYLESIIIDLIETRQFNNKATVIVYDSLDMASYLSNLFSYLASTETTTIKTTNKPITKKKDNKKGTDQTESKVKFF